MGTENLYADGNIRIRGKRENIIRFLQHELVPVYELENNQMEDRPIRIEESQNGWELHLHRDPDTSTKVYFKGSNKYWIDMDTVKTIDMSNGKKGRDDQVICLDDYYGSWQMDHSFFKQKALEYRLDIRIFTWSGSAWRSSVYTFFRNGDVEEDTRKYEDYLWDCPILYYGEY